MLPQNSLCMVICAKVYAQKALFDKIGAQCRDMLFQMAGVRPECDRRVFFNVTRQMLAEQTAASRTARAT